MNILIDMVPEKVTIEGRSYKINTDFRIGILFEELIQDNDISEKDKINQALRLYYSVIPPDKNQAVEKMLWFYRGGKDELEKKKGAGGTGKRVFDYEYDDGYIYAAFLSQYGVDLQDVEYLHWWKFRAMFRALKDDNIIVKIMGYRGVNLSSIKDKDQRLHYQELQKLYALPRQKADIDYENEVRQALLNGGNVEAVLNK